ncbi:hypothetical protein [Paraburkholderia sacchari]|uniref:hypothetical protein n=1 Tax=Paraburkholderia sacchari TaxID=159450 RepID=UPI000541F4D5|nr:hypothetical protein [Paraburkholderia sacchari]NLP63032.1 hypothetical protein [Paraburkholderia sacchari]
MALQSKLFGGDAALEAAAVSDNAHIMPGASGQHVKKIQIALIAVDSAQIDADEMSSASYGPSTAFAVLAFKSSRVIINRSYQTKPDNIVGKMTVTRLDDEFAAYEKTIRKPLALRPISPGPRSAPIVPFAQIVAQDVKGKMQFTAFAGARSPRIKPIEGIELATNQIGTIEVEGGIGCVVDTTDHYIATIFRPDQPNAHDGQFEVDRDPQVFAVRGRNWGSTMVVVHRKGSTGLLDTESLRVTIKDSRATVYTLTHAHNHQPCHNCWDAICNDDCNRPFNLASGYLWVLAKAHARPKTVVDEAIKQAFSDKPIALVHLYWYLNRHGQEFNEDHHLKAWLTGDSVARRYIADEITERRRRKTAGAMIRFTMEFDQEMFGNQDYRFAFGTIDYLDVQADFVANTVKIWFRDCYEWHPPHPQFKPPCLDSKFRDTNFLHAALVQMKLEGAADFWMQGEATFPLSIFML